MRGMTFGSGSVRLLLLLLLLLQRHMAGIALTMTSVRRVMRLVSYCWEGKGGCVGCKALERVGFVAQGIAREGRGDGDG